MTEQSFATQMNRLANNFGKGTYGTEKAQLIWLSVRELSSEWFTRVANDMIGNQRQAPLLPDFVDAARAERHRIYEAEKREQAPTFDKWASRFTGEDERMMAQTIVKRLRQDFADSEWNNYLRMLDGMAAGEKAMGRTT